LQGEGKVVVGVRAEVARRGQEAAHSRGGGAVRSDDGRVAENIGEPMRIADAELDGPIDQEPAADEIALEAGLDAKELAALIERVFYYQLVTGRQRCAIEANDVVGEDGAGLRYLQFFMEVEIEEAEQEVDAGRAMGVVQLFEQVEFGAPQLR